MFPIIFHELSDKVSYIKNKQGIIIRYNAIEKSIIKLITTVLSKLGISTDKKEEEIKSMQIFQELINYILKEYKKSGKK